jgi:hypothetical protein
LKIWIEVINGTLKLGKIKNSSTFIMILLFIELIWYNGLVFLQ